MPYGGYTEPQFGLDEDSGGYREGLGLCNLQLITSVNLEDSGGYILGG